MKPPTAPPAIEAVILDMDGLLIDTEPVWREIETRIFAELGLTLTDADMADTMGVRIEDVVAHRRQTRAWPGAATGVPSNRDIADRVVDGMIAHVCAEGAPQPGVHQAIAVFRSLGLPLAIASSSPHRLIDAVCARLGLDEIRIRKSATDEVAGKPSPDVYLTAARSLGVAPRCCLAVEDSPNGVRAAKAAGMRCIAVPDPGLGDDPAFEDADIRLSSLAELDESHLRSLGWDA